MAQTFGVDVRTIGGLLLWYQQKIDVKDRHRYGQPRITTSQTDTFIRVTALRNHFNTSTDLNIALQVQEKWHILAYFVFGFVSR